MKYITDGSGSVTTDEIPLEDTTIDCCDNVMYLENYKFLQLRVTNSHYFFPAWWDWDIDIQNNNPFDIRAYYLNELCFEGDAKIFGGNTDNHKGINLKTSGQEKYQNVRINHNGTAGYATAAIEVNRVAGGNLDPDTCLLVTYANNLKYSGGVGSLKSYTNIVV